ncbi:MAG: ATP-dependent sacrificial sulfur transferase LarE [Clostridiales bacterium]
MILQQFFSENPKVALGFSGGVDSSYLLYAGIRCGAQVKAYFVKSVFQPAFELEDAQRLAAQLGAGFEVIEADILTDRQVAGNPANRCYWCKQVVFNALKDRARAAGYETIIDGSNASDRADDRPGMQALAELGVKSPLREYGLTKGEIRRLSKEADLFTWNKPSYACLATRIPTGRLITAQLLQRVERAEEALFALGFSDLRVRLLEESARIQLPASQMAAALEQRQEILAAIKPYFASVLLDLEERKGELQ